MRTSHKRTTYTNSNDGKTKRNTRRMVQHLDDVNIQKQPIKQIVKTRGLFMANIISKVYKKVILKKIQRTNRSKPISGRRQKRKIYDRPHHDYTRDSKQKLVPEQTNIHHVYWSGKMFQQTVALEWDNWTVERWNEDAEMILKMNEKATIHIYINTPVGMTKLKYPAV